VDEYIADCDAIGEIEKRGVYDSDSLGDSVVATVAV
jgi:hypothetical protein